MRDRFGISWRPELAAGILAHRERVDVVEVLADDLFDVSALGLRAVRTLGTHLPVVLHGVGLGLASCSPVDERQLRQMARVVEAVRPEGWSEHLAFVRAGGIEVGHLAAPPRNAATLEGLARNLERAEDVVGSRPALENIATLLEPPGSDRDEAAWVTQATTVTGAPLLLDLHNLYANATNFRFDPAAFLDHIPSDRYRFVHLAGGKRIPASDGRPRILDDHLHDVPDPVFALLEEVGRRAPGPLTVILERDGAYPAIVDLLAQLDRARTALARGRARQRREESAA